MFLSDHLNKEKVEIKEEDLVCVEKCGVCGSHKFIVLAQYRAVPEIHFVKCKKCKAITYDRQLSQGKIDGLYEHYQYYDDSIEENGSVTFYGYDRFAKHLYKQFMRAGKLGGGWMEKQLDILDFGGGDGSLALAFAEYALQKKVCRRIKILVIDYCGQLCVSKNKAIRLEHMHSLGQLPDKEAYNVVIASGIIEHLPTPGPDMGKLFGVMKKGGVVYFRTPYVYPLWRCFRKIGVEYDMLFPGHIWDFGGDSWWRSLPGHMDGKGDHLEMIASGPSIVEKTFKAHFWIALASYCLKAPWYLCHKWPFVGGWEAVYVKK